MFIEGKILPPHFPLSDAIEHFFYWEVLGKTVFAHFSLFFRRITWHSCGPNLG